MGYKNIKIYNGGIKDWKKSGLPVESVDPLPEYNTRFISSAELLEKIKAAAEGDCVNAKNHPLLTILDLRNENHLKSDRSVPVIKTGCRLIKALFDELVEERLRKKIPRRGLVVTVTETGNRDDFAIRYLTTHGYKNIVGLRFGMRSWIKQNYPVEHGN